VDQKGNELAAVIAEIRQRVRTRGANGSGEIPLADLMPLLHARDAAEGKVASIGTVNPRPPGLVNNTAQWIKRQVARALDWHVREQVEFNRAAVACVQSTIEALNECNRTMAALSARIEQVASSSNELRDEARELTDIRAHWADWRVTWEKKLVDNETHFLRSVAELQQSFNYRVSLMDQNYRDQMKSQHSDYERALERATTGIQKRAAEDVTDMQRRLWDDMTRLRAEYEAMIHSELRLVRQKMSFTQTAAQVVEAAPAEFKGIDWLRFAEKFRGSEEAIRERQKIYAERFQGATNVLDIGCGRGELLQVLRDAGIAAHGIDLNDDSVSLCRSKGLHAEKADLFAYLNDLPDGSLGGAVCCQVVEHLPPERLPEMIRLVGTKLRAGALFAMETPNPECLAIFATHFYIDPTHRHPLPPVLLSFYMEEAGFGRIQVERLFPAVESMPSLAELPEAFRKEFFGALDYAIFGERLG